MPFLAGLKRLPDAPPRPGGRARRVSGTAATRVVGSAVGVLAGAVVGLGVPVLLAGPAAAHDRLVSSIPAEGATVDVAPATVQLTMSAELVSLGAQVQVSGPSGVVSTGQAQVDGTTITQAVTPASPAGTYEVQWRVTSSDGHPISGSFGFTATAAPTPAAVATSTMTPPSTSPTPSATSSSTSPTSPAASPTTSTSSTPSTDSVASTNSGTSTALLLGAVALALAVIAGVVVALTRRRRRS
ncbi:copper resistance CopC family protein [Kineococcus radiotolerans]|uniref:Copper resistance protein CopC n=1 Tax=Kineococcus radiotolerans (strain ATCC BAA-149 / DSM 14245 / SRS30216) TaxID=266940 RepID=A6WGR5_KINRD|nr:copper resistance CopC family protein [Kineococcus radiotolerans]ABS06004.1 copper resistance protein CopC [Kineococcus radiotolerans SRS30216 = ATCC BAA-149]